ncbi:RDD family protein [Streptomyces sp. TRM66268-LWL]|uniref:RDD family protein n=1 Tax=Streptomyces polyasparticus TaxID=2767826 RepID=A0ABR7SRV8_9ACTN|nr:RDD family protein [Streptomyces polyasparticus]MBC9718245.1 RDD family protein [Streptomyces polyasparticus]
MTTEPPPPGSGQPEDDPFRKQPPSGSGSGSPYDSPQGATPPPGDPYGTPPPPPPPPSGGSPYGGPQGPYGTPPPPPPGGGDPYGGGGGAFGGYGGGPDPLQGMPPLADMGKRVVARIIDALIIGVPLALIQLPFRKVETDTDDLGDVVSQSYSGSSFIWTIIACVAFVGYEWFMVKKNGQTVGKKLMNLRVANLQDGSTPLSNAALMRGAVLWLPALLCCPCVWWLIVIVMMAVDKPYKQGLHDKAAKTVVVSTV